MMRNTNIIRFGNDKASANADDHYRRLHNEMLERRRIHNQQLIDYKNHIIQKREDKKRTQAENGAFWL